MSEYKYRISKYSYDIKKYKVHKETSKYVYYIYFNREVKESKNTDWHMWLDTFKEAKKELMNFCQNKINSYEKQLAREKESMNTIFLLDTAEDMSHKQTID